MPAACSDIDRYPLKPTSIDILENDQFHAAYPKLERTERVPSNSFFSDLLPELWSFGKSSTQRVEETVVALAGLRPRRSLRGVGQRWRRAEPEANERSHGLDRDRRVALWPLQPSVSASEIAVQRQRVA